MDAKTEELRDAHDTLAELYAERHAAAHDEMPVERAVLGLFRELVLDSGVGSSVGDIGCGPGRLTPHLAGSGLTAHGVDLSPEMIRIARRDHSAFPFGVADLRHLPFADSSLAGAACWYSLIYLAPADRARAFGELARVVRPGGHLTTAFMVGDDAVRRGGRTTGLGVEFDVYWFSPETMERYLTEAGFRVVFRGGRPAGAGEYQPQGYLIGRRT